MVYFVENFCIDIYKRYWSGIFLWCLYLALYQGNTGLIKWTDVNSLNIWSQQWSHFVLGFVVVESFSITDWFSHFICYKSGEIFNFLESVLVIFVILGIWSFRLDYLICWSYYYIFISIRLVVVALLLFLILIIWAFSFFLFCLRKKSCQVCYFFKEPAFGFIDFSLFLYSTFCLSLLH